MRRRHPGPVHSRVVRPLQPEFASLEQTRPGIPFTYTGCQIERDLIAADMRTSEEAAAKLWLLYH